MKQKILSIFMFLALIVCIPAVNAAELGNLADSTVLSISLVNYDPNPAMAGNVVEARIGVENIGSMDINDLMLEIVPEYPFQLVSGETAVKSIGIIQGYLEGSNANIKIIKYRMLVNKDTPAGSYELKVKYYEAGSTSATQKSLSLDIKNRDSAIHYYLLLLEKYPNSEYARDIRAIVDFANAVKVGKVPDSLKARSLIKYERKEQIDTLAIQPAEKGKKNKSLFSDPMELINKPTEFIKTLTEPFSNPEKMLEDATKDVSDPKKIQEKLTPEIKFQNPFEDMEPDSTKKEQKPEPPK